MARPTPSLAAAIGHARSHGNTITNRELREVLGVGNRAAHTLLTVWRKAGWFARVKPATWQLTLRGVQFEEPRSLFDQAAALAERGVVRAKDVSLWLGVPRSQAQWLLSRLYQRGRVRRLSAGKYRAAGAAREAT